VIDQINLVPRLVSSLIDCEKKGLYSVRGVPGAVESLYQRCRKPASVANRAAIRAFECETISRSISGDIRVESVANRLLNPYQPTDQQTVLTPEDATSVFRMACERMFTDSLSNPKRDLGALSVNLVERFTGGDPRFLADGFDLIYALPFLGCYGQMEEMYMKIMRSTSNFSTSEDFEFPLFVRTLALPMTDKSFGVSDKDTGRIVSSKLAEKILQICRLSNVPMLDKPVKGPWIYSKSGESFNPQGTAPQD
jgi:hypothetical protein